jgi:hypothetical protein
VEKWRWVLAGGMDERLFSGNFIIIIIIIVVETRRSPSDAA